jgi:AmiR/NasT family two-component response regulator
MAIRVLIAEDEAIIRRDLKEMLEAEGYEVVADFGRGDEALEAIRALRPDIAVVDIKMPGMDGLALAKEVGRDSLCAIVILTAFSQRALVEQARDAGVMAYLVKPFNVSDLVPAIELALARFEERQVIEAELVKVQDEAKKLEERLQTRVLLDRAKAKLMEEFHMSEPSAFRYLQKTAMDQRTRIRDVAERVLSGELSPAG